jgi:hypothetical protein
MRQHATSILLLIFVCAVLGVARSASAAGYPLLVGTYKTQNGTVEPGRATESWPSDGGSGEPGKLLQAGSIVAAGGEGQIGNLIWAESWDGSVLGANWTLTCPQISGPPNLIYDGVVGGNGQRIYSTPYGGGALWLSGAGAWGGGAPYYLATLTSFTVIATKQYVGGQVVGVVSNINLMGSFEGEGQCFTMAISNAELVGMTGNPYLPPPTSGWPALHGPGECSLIGSHGTYWDVHDVTLSILGSCTTPGQTSTWGRVKSLYR